MNTWKAGRDLTKHYYLKKKKKAFYSNLSIKDNKNADCKNPQKVFKEYGLKT